MNAFAWCGTKRSTSSTERPFAESTRLITAGTSRGVNAKISAPFMYTLLAVCSFPLSSICTGAFGSYGCRMPPAACGNNEVRRAAPIGSVHERAGEPSACSGRVALQQCSRRAVGEYAPYGLVARVEVLAVRVRCKKQQAVRLVGFDQALR
jgi:hypothetical protein